MRIIKIVALINCIAIIIGCSSCSALHTHVWDNGVITQSATCTQEGIRTFTCSCGETMTEAINALGHDYDSLMIEPTCTTDGYTINTCKRCNNTLQTNVIKATGHSGIGICKNCNESYNKMIFDALSKTQRVTINTGTEEIKFGQYCIDDNNAITVKIHINYIGACAILNYFDIEYKINPDGTWEWTYDYPYLAFGKTGYAVFGEIGTENLPKINKSITTIPYTRYTGGMTYSLMESILDLVTSYLHEVIKDIDAACQQTDGVTLSNFGLINYK